jgi:nucleoside-diphosphate-sugar epimerase
MTTDQRLDNMDSLLRTLVESVTRASQNIEQLVMTTQFLEQAVANVFNGMTELRADINVDLKAELIEIKEAVILQAAVADKQAETAQTQAENVRSLIQMLNQRQA